MTEVLPINEIVSPLIVRRNAEKAAIILVTHAGDDPPKTLLNKVEQEIETKGLKVHRLGLLELAPNPVAELVLLSQRDIDVFSIVCEPKSLEESSGALITAVNIHRNTYAREGICAIFWMPIWGLRPFSNRAPNFLDFRTRLVEVGFDGFLIPPTTNELRKQINKAKSPEEILHVLKKLYRLFEQSVADEKDVSFLHEMTLRSLQNSTLETPFKAKELILEHLIPICIQDASSSQSRFDLGQIRRRLADWINQYPSTVSEEIRDAILNRLLEAIGGESPRGACLTVSEIGFRRPDIVEALWRIIDEQNNETGDTALSTLVSLGVLGKERERSIEEIHCRMAQRYNPSLASALHRLADRRSLEPIMKHWLLITNMDQGRWDFEHAIGLLPAIADAAPEDAPLQDKVWGHVLEALKAHSEKVHPVAILSFRSDLAPRCNTPDVVRVLLRSLQSEFGDSSSPTRRSYLIQLRLTECVRPLQQLAWHGALNDRLVHVLKTDACRDTQSSGRFTTELIDSKEMALETLLRLGCSEVLDWFEPAVVNETNSFVRHKLCTYFACFRLDPLPESIMHWITEEYETGKQKPAEKWVFRLGAIDVAWSTASSQAFEALLNFGLTFEGSIPRKVVDAVADIAPILTRQGNSRVPGKLLEHLTTVGQKKRHQVVAAGALEALSRHEALPEEFIPSLEKCLTDPGRDERQRALLASTFGFLPKRSLSSRVWQCLCELSKHQDAWIASHALGTLARHDRLVEFEDLLSFKLGLKRFGNQWDLLQESAFEWAAYFTAWLYQFHPDEFTPAIIRIISSHEWFSVVQVLGFWEKLSQEDRHISEKIRSLLIQRAVDRQAGSYSEKDMFHYLAVLTPEKLTLQPWEDLWEQWLPGARQALAEALGEAQHETVADKNRTAKLLTALMDDGSYAVRRSAYRSLALKSPETLYAWVECFSQLDAPVERRKRAAEAWGWLSYKNNLWKKDEKFYVSLAHDPEVAVRQSSLHARADRRNRMWAFSYLQRILKIRGSTNEEILKAWPYGKALARLGDDICLRELRKHIHANDLPPNVRFWLTEISRELDKNWQKTMREWPQPWVTYEGQVMEGHGAVIASDGKETPVEYTIWHKPASAPSQYHAWNGIAFLSEGHLLDFNSVAKEFKLVLENSSSGKILITQNHLNWFVFKNQGPFPA